MTVVFIPWALKQKISSTHKFVLVILADHSNRQGECWPSVSRICEESSLSESSVRRSIIYLSESGLIKKEERTRKNGSQTSNLYTLLTSMLITETGPSLFEWGSLSEIHPPPGTVTAPDPSLEPNIKKGFKNELSTQEMNKEPTVVPDDFSPSDELVLKVATNNLPNPTTHVVQAFIAYNKGKGTLASDWQAMFEGYLLNRYQMNSDWKPKKVEPVYEHIDPPAKALQGVVRRQRGGCAYARQALLFTVAELGSMRNVRLGDEAKVLNVFTKYYDKILSENGMLSG